MAACSEQERVAEERKAVEEKQQEISLLQAEAQREVDKAMPALEAAMGTSRMRRHLRSD